MAGQPGLAGYTVSSSHPFANVHLCLSCGSHITLCLHPVAACLSFCGKAGVPFQSATWQVYNIAVQSLSHQT